MQTIVSRTILIGILFAVTVAYGMGARLARLVRNTTTAQLFLVLCVFFLSGCATSKQEMPLRGTRTAQPALVREDCPPGAAPLGTSHGTACWPSGATYIPWNCRITVDDFGYKSWDCSAPATVSP